MEFIAQSAQAKTRGVSRNWSAWGHLYDLAIHGGWEPQGTQHFGYDEVGFPLQGETCSPDWCGTYFSNDGQVVTADDARNLADALECALPDVPDHDALEHKLEKSISPSGVPMIGISPETPINAFEYFSGDGKNLVKEFIKFARESGGFQIF